MTRTPPLRPLLRWTSLVAALVALVALGGARLHLHDFVLFLGLVMGLAAAVVAVFVATGGRDEPGDAPP